MSFFSNSAWAFLISAFLIITAGFFFVRLKRREPTKEKDNNRKDAKPLKVDPIGVALAVLLCGPIYVIYWYHGFHVWKKMFADDNPTMWIIYGVLLAVMSFGVYQGMRPPTEEEERNRTIPGRRLLLLLMSPFALVYGMIYLAGFHPPWP